MSEAEETEHCGGSCQGLRRRSWDLSGDRRGEPQGLGPGRSGRLSWPCGVGALHGPLEGVWVLGRQLADQVGGELWHLLTAHMQFLELLALRAEGRTGHLQALNPWLQLTWKDTCLGINQFYGALAREITACQFLSCPEGGFVQRVGGFVGS